MAVATAYESASRALQTNSAQALRELFTALSRSAESDGRIGVRVSDLNVLLLLIHASLAREAAPLMRELIYRTEQRTAVFADEFREALCDAHILGIDDAIWKPKFAAQAPCPAGQLSGEELLNSLGGGSTARLPRITVTEAAFMAAVTEAFAADYAERSEHLRRLWERQAQDEAGTLSYPDFKSTLQSAEPSLSVPMLRSLYLTSVETSRSCSQFEDGFCPLLGSLEVAFNNNYGGDVVTFKLLQLTAMRCRLFMKDSGADVGEAKSAQLRLPTDIKGSLAPRPNTPESPSNAAKDPKRALPDPRRRIGQTG